jgi:uncharacterized protein involved in response to NO
MTLAVMTRASLGHTGRSPSASLATQAIYGAVVASALARIAAVLAPSSLAWLCAAAILWACAFVGFAITYGNTLIHAPLRGSAR